MKVESKRAADKMLTRDSSRGRSPFRRNVAIAERRIARSNQPSPEINCLQNPALNDALFSLFFAISVLKYKYADDF